MVGVNIPFVLTLQDGDTIEHITARWRIRLFSPLLKKIFRDAAQVQVISNYLGTFAKQMGFRGEPILVPNGVNISRFTQVNQKDVAGIKQTLHKKDTELFLVTTSRLVEKNGLEDVIRALPSIPNTRFLILGDGPLREHLEHVVRETNMSDRVVFLGHVAHEHLPAYLHVSDIFIRPSLSEGLGSSFLEAMAAGLPVIATPVGGIPDFLFDIEEHGEKATGIFCQPHNSESIAFAVKRLTQDVGMRQHIAANGSNLVLKNYDWDDIARKMAHILEDA
jgi:glycosyltransferase involved in cell wall biosynthesis